MGAVNSAVITSQETTNILNEVAIDNISGCTTSNINVQNINLGSNNYISNLLIEQSIQSNINCVASSETQSQILTDLVNKLAAQANTSSKFLLGFGVNTSVVTNNTVNDIVTKYMVKNIQQCGTSFDYTQNVDAGTYNQIIGASIQQLGNNYVSCMFSASSVQELSNNVTNDINLKATASSGGLNLTAIIIIAVLLIVAVAIIIGISKQYRKNQNNNNNNSQQPLLSTMPVSGEDKIK